MNKIKYKIILIVVMVCLCVWLGHFDLIGTDVVVEEVNEDVYVSVLIEEDVSSIIIDEYLLGVVIGEMPASFELEALKAQVVASRTYVYARGLSVDDSTSTQVYLDTDLQSERLGSRYDEYVTIIQQAIQETSGEVLMVDQQYISALFFSSSGGYTQNNDDYFVGAPVSYLRSVVSSGEESINPNYYHTYTFSYEEIEYYFGNHTMEIISYYDQGSVEDVQIGNIQYSGREVREILNLASSYFTIENTTSGYIVTTRGSGHGVGMSQYGAQLMALDGFNYIDILEHYYSGVEIIKK